MYWFYKVQVGVTGYYYYLVDAHLSLAKSIYTTESSMFLSIIPQCAE